MKHRHISFANVLPAESQDAESSGSAGAKEQVAFATPELPGLRTAFDRTDASSLLAARLLHHIGSVMIDAGELLRLPVLADITDDARKIREAAERAKRDAERRRDRHRAAADGATDEDTKKDERTLQQGAEKAAARAQVAIDKANDAERKASDGDVAGAKEALKDAQAALDDATVRAAIRAIASADNDEVIDGKLLEMKAIAAGAEGGVVPDLLFLRIAGRNLRDSGVRPDDPAYEDKLARLIRLLKKLLSVEG